MDTYKLEKMFTIKKIKRLIFMSKKQPNDPRIGYKPPSNLVELIEKDLNFEKELEGFQGSFESNELWDIFSSELIYFF